MITNKTIFISALDWGLGHATRCIPIISELEKNNKIIIGATPLTKPIFKVEFPHLQIINVPAYNIKYSAFFPLWLKLVFDWPRISKIIKKENKLLDVIITENKIDVVISDNRFGMYSKKIKSIFITHQLFLKTPFLNSFCQKINKKYILKFDEVWVPDFEDNEKSLSGDLSHGKQFHTNVKYIGPQSRLQKIDDIEKKYDYLFLISGPQPQRSIIIKTLLKKAESFPYIKFSMVTPDLHTQELKNVKIFVSPEKEILSAVILSSKKIICRSGYSTLMDFYFLNKKEIILVPTPGQTEQEYLANYWQKKFGAILLKQGSINTYILKP